MISRLKDTILIAIFVIVFLVVFITPAWLIFWLMTGENIADALFRYVDKIKKKQ